MAEAVTFKWRFTFDTTATIAKIANIADIPQGFKLFQNYPNPFNPKTTIHFQLPTSGHVSLKIFNLFGQLVQTLLCEVKQPGIHSIKWDSKNCKSNLVSSGLYVLRMEFGEFVWTKKLLLIR